MSEATRDLYERVEMLNLQGSGFSMTQALSVDIQISRVLGVRHGFRQIRTISKFWRQKKKKQISPVFFSCTKVMFISLHNKYKIQFYVIELNSVGVINFIFLLINHYLVTTY